MTASYKYRIYTDRPRTIWVGPHFHRPGWHKWGSFATPEQAKRVLALLKERDEEAMTDEDAQQVIRP